MNRSRILLETTNCAHKMRRPNNTPEIASSLVETSTSSMLSRHLRYISLKAPDASGTRAPNRQAHQSIMLAQYLPEALTFDGVLLVPAYSEVAPV